MFDSLFPKRWTDATKLMLLKAMKGGAAAVVKTVTGTAPIMLAGAVSNAIISLTQTGKCTQATTPTPSDPVDIVCNNGAIKYSPNVAPGGGIYADGTPEVLTVNSHTATVENLFAVGAYADEQEVIGGDITRQTWAVAFDGTEAWEEYDGVFYVYTETLGKSGREIGANFAPLCTRFSGASGGFYGLQDGDIEFASDGSIEVKWSGVADLAAFKAKLAEWNAAGEPLIVVYPAPDRTESATAQPLNTTSGTNTVSVSSNVDPVTLTCEYMGTA